MSEVKGAQLDSQVDAVSVWLIAAMFYDIQTCVSYLAFNWIKKRELEKAF